MRSEGCLRSRSVVCVGTSQFIFHVKHKDMHLSTLLDESLDALHNERKRQEHNTTIMSQYTDNAFSHCKSYFSVKNGLSQSAIQPLMLLIKSARGYCSFALLPSLVI